MPAPTFKPLRAATSADLPIIAAVSYTAMTCNRYRRFEDCEAIVADAIHVYGRLPSFLLCRYAARVAEHNLDAPGSLAVLADIFTVAELELPFICLIRLTLVVTGLALLPGYQRQVASAIGELRALALDLTQDKMMRARAAVLLAQSAQHGHLAA